MFEYTCPKCRTNSVVAALPQAAVSPCRQCGLVLQLSSQAGPAPGGWGSPLLFGVSASAGLTVAAALLLTWAFFGRGPADRDDSSRIAQEGSSSPEKKQGEEKKSGPG